MTTPEGAASRGRLRVALVGLATVVALLAAVPTALADGASLSVTTADGQPDPVAHIARVFTVSGTAAAGKHLYVKHRAAGGAACAPSAFSDSGTWPDVSFYGPAVSGQFSFQRILSWGSPGTWMFCFWLASSETTVTTPMMQTVTFRQPNGTIGAAVYPAVPRPGEQAQVTVAGTTEATRRVYAKVRAADGTPCATSYDADPGGGLIGGWTVDGPFSIPAYAAEANPGQYVICLWLAGGSDDTLPIGGPQQQIFAVARPPRPQVASITELNCHTKRRITRVRASKVTSICMRYRFSTPPAPGLSVSVAYVTPRHVTYKTVSSMWPEGASRTMTTRALPERAYRHRHGTWFAVLRVDGAWIRTKSIHVT